MVRWIADTACVDTAAQLADGTRIGQYCVIGPHVSVKYSCRLGDHTYVGCCTEIGAECDIAEFCVIGGREIDLRRGTAKSVGIRIGLLTRLGRAVVIESGTSAVPTILGARCVVSSLAKLESSARLGHDVHLGSGVVIGSQAELAENASVGHGTMVQAGVRLGRNCAVGTLSQVGIDIPPHMLADGRPATVRGVNVAGLQRLGLTHQGLHGGELFVVSVEQLGHAVVQLAQLLFKVIDSFGRVIALHHQQAVARQQAGELVDGVVGHTVSRGVGDVAAIDVVCQHFDRAGKVSLQAGVEFGFVQ